MADLSRKEKERLRHREEILDAALDLFAENGYINVSMQKIAERAEFATGTLYNFFENKEELYRALMQKHIDDAHRILTEALEDGDDAVQRIRNFIRAKGRIFREHVSFARLYLSEIRGLGFVLGKETFLDRLNDLIARLKAVIEEGIQNGMFRDLDPEFLAVSLNGLSSVILIHMAENPGRFDYTDNIDNMLNVFFKGVLTDKEADIL
jgi:AcrR family transcriptional regulator